MARSGEKPKAIRAAVETTAAFLEVSSRRRSLRSLQRIRSATMRDVKIKRVYDAPATPDGYRVLVDRLWPRGITKERAHLCAWVKEVAPSTELRKWFSHDASRMHERSEERRVGKE